MKTRVIIVAHPDRINNAVELANILDGLVILDSESAGALANHRRSLGVAADLGYRPIIMEDDAIPVRGFIEKAEAVIDRFPDDLVSFYLGTGRPPQWQKHIGNVIKTARPGVQEYMRLPTLIHGVCYTMPPRYIDGVLALANSGPADYAIGDAWRALTGRDVIYTCMSLVDHEDGESVEKHPDGQRRTETRRAWALDLS